MAGLHQPLLVWDSCTALMLTSCRVEPKQSGQRKKIRIGYRSGLCRAQPKPVPFASGPAFSRLPALWKFAVIFRA
jgi:hypothetical protein